MTLNDSLNDIDIVLADQAAYRQGYLDGLKQAEAIYAGAKLQIIHARNDVITVWAQSDGSSAKGGLVDDFDFDARAKNILRRHEIITIQALCQYSMEELLSVRGLGRKTVQDMVTQLEARGLSLRQQSR